MIMSREIYSSHKPWDTFFSLQFFFSLSFNKFLNISPICIFAVDPLVVPGEVVRQRRPVVVEEEGVVGEGGHGDTDLDRSIRQG